MQEYLHKDSLFYIIPEEVDHASAFCLEKVENGLMRVVSNNDININAGDKIEIFINSNEGIIYSKTIVENVKNKSIMFEEPKDYEILQRRENKRIKINKPVIIKKDGCEKEVILEDISAGGIKITTDEQLTLNCEYEVVFNFDGLDNVFSFTPQRMVSSDSGEVGIYHISGQINSKSPTDKITLIQYCYKKIFEQSNRK